MSHEVLKVEEHPKGGHIVTVRRSRRQSCGFLWLQERRVEWQETYLRKGSLDWYRWPECVAVEYFADLYKAWDSWETRQSHNPPVEIMKPQPVGNPRCCMFCRDEMSGLAAFCLKCSGAMHLDCAKEAGSQCRTPGCSSGAVRSSAAKA